MNIEEYQCDDCGATRYNKTEECCDTCILKFYFENPFASTLDEYVTQIQLSTDDWKNN